ncbi:hypothetical protein AB6D20_025385 [Vibrio splendidus]
MELGSDQVKRSPEASLHMTISMTGLNIHHRPMPPLPQGGLLSSFDRLLAIGKENLLVFQ